MSNLSSTLQTRYHRPQQVERLNDLVPIWICAISSPRATIKATPEQPIPPQTRTLKLSTKVCIFELKSYPQSLTPTSLSRIRFLIFLITLGLVMVQSLRVDQSRKKSGNQRRSAPGQGWLWYGKRKCN